MKRAFSPFSVNVYIHNTSVSIIISITIAVALNWGGFAPRGHLGMSGDIFAGQNGAGVEATDI